MRVVLREGMTERTWHAPFLRSQFAWSRQALLVVWSGVEFQEEIAWPANRQCDPVANQSIECCLPHQTLQATKKQKRRKRKRRKTVMMLTEAKRLMWCAVRRGCQSRLHLQDPLRLVQESTECKTQSRQQQATGASLL